MTPKCMNTQQDIGIDNSQVQEIAELIKRDKVIPIIGYDLLRIRNQTRDEFIKHVFDNIDHRFIRDAEIFTTFQNDFPQFSTTELINYIYHSLESRKKENFTFEFSKAINKVRAESPINWEPIIKLISIPHFKLFVNVTCTNVIEIAVNAYRSTNKKEGYEVYGPLKPDRRDLPNPKSFFFENPYSIVAIQKPTIYNLFGTHNTDSKYLLTDVEYVDMLVELLQKECFCPNFRNYLTNASLLFIGCSFSSWFLRFFTRFWAGPQMDVRLAAQYNALIDSLGQSDSFERSFFLSNFKISKLSGNTEEFINALYRQIGGNNTGDDDDHAPSGAPSPTNGSPDPAPTDNFIKPLNAYNNFVMISYNTLDRELALQIRTILIENNISVWMDVSKLDVGDQLEERITSAIDRCCLVLQVISNKISERKESNPYFLLEWQLILHQQKKRMPIFVDNVSDDLLIPNNLSKFRDVIRETMDQNILGIQLQRSDPKVTEEHLTVIRDIQYNSLIKDLKFK